MKSMKLLTIFAISAVTCSAYADNFTLRMGGGHTTGLTYIRVYDEYFAPEVIKRVKAKTGHDIRFIKAWGGSVAKVDGVIEAVQKATLDIGLSPVSFEQSRASLLNYSAYVPFTTSDPVLQQKVADRMLKEVPAIQVSMKPYNVHVLTQMVSEAYGIASTFDWNTIAGLKGKRVALAGTNAPLVLPLSGVPVTLGIGEHYQALQNGLCDASLFYISGLEAFKLKEVAKYFNKPGLGSLSTAAALMNLDTRAKLPKDVVAIIDQVASESAMRVAEISKQRDIDVEAKVRAEGIKVNVLPESERQLWANAVKDLPGKSAKELDAKGQPASAVLKSYIQFLTEAGYNFPVKYSL